jgi:hypothetical protein
MSAIFDDIEGTVKNPFRQALFTTTHYPINKFGNQDVMIFGIWQDFPFFNFSLSGHDGSFSFFFALFGKEVLFGFFCSVSGAALFSVLNAHSIEGATNDMISNPWQVFHPSSTDEDNRMFLEVMANPWNIGGHFDPIR